MPKWIYLGDNKFECSKCMYIIQHKYEPKKCPNCGTLMENAFNRMFPPNNAPQKNKKHKIIHSKNIKDIQAHLCF